MHPLQFRPILKHIRWGGRRLGTLLGKPLGEATDYAESWEIADCGPDQSTVLEGPYAGWTLHRLVETHGTALLGLQSHFAQFPLLVKFLDAHDRLSVQVHPNDDQARGSAQAQMARPRLGWCCMPMQARRLYTGLKRGVDREKFVRSLDSGASKTVCTLAKSTWVIAYSFQRGRSTPLAMASCWRRFNNPAT